jgi:beta-aspartyl-peptidase (threonine type)
MPRHRFAPSNTAVLAVAGALALLPSGSLAPRGPAIQHPQFFLVVHGGAGTIRRAEMTPAQDSAYRAKLTEAIRAGYDVLRGGGASLDAVMATITVLEESPLFNAGRGAVFTNAGTNELDAAIMDGASLRAGAVAGVRHIKHPIALARLVMQRSGHVLLAGDGAEAFAKEQGMALVPRSYFFTQRRWDELQRAKAAAKVHGTVGAVALDQAGRLAAGTSTGGITNKRWGRIGDSPIIGAGTYASANCAVSATGVGEFFMRNVVAYDICARLLYRGETLAAAADSVVMRKLVAQGGEGGVIALDRDGHFVTTFNSEGMYRGHVGPDGQIVVRIYRDEERR